jgi:hypothetical protein
MSDAAAGEISAAIDTLNTAMSLIRSSRIGEEEGCKALLNTLQVTIVMKQSLSYVSGGIEKCEKQA